MQILFTRFPLESRLGGAEIQTVSLMEGLMARGHAVAFAGSCPVLLRLCNEKHIPAVEWHIGKPPVTPWLAVSFWWRKRAMRRSLETLLTQFSHVDAVCMLSITEKLLLTDVAATQGKRAVWIEHDRIGRWLTKNPWLPLLRHQHAHARIVTVSQMSKTLMEHAGFDGNRITAVPNGIDSARFPEKGVPAHEGLHIGCVARLTKDKGVDVLLEAVKAVPHATLTVIGDGPERATLQRLADGRTVFHAAHDDLNGFYRSLDILVLPSRDNDPFGMAAAEAMLCGVAVVVTEQCGIAGSLKNGADALMVPANDAPALASALQKLTDAGMRAELAQRGKQTALQRFSLEAMVSSYESLLLS